MAMKKSKAGKGQKSKRGKQHADNNRRESTAASKLSLFFRDYPSFLGTNVKMVYVIGIVIVVLSVAMNQLMFDKSPVVDAASSITEEEEVTGEFGSPLEHLVRSACEDGNCDVDELRAEGRKIFAGRTLHQDQKLLEVPRSLQIWSLDAFRDNYVQTQLAGAIHAGSGKPLVQQAFLAAHLARLVQNNQHRKGQSASPMASYLANLPTYRDYETALHPVTLEAEEQIELFGAHSQTYFLMSKRKQEIQSEYRALATKSSDFGNSISLEAYTAARLSVQTRSFAAGSFGEQNLSSIELAAYQERFGIQRDHKMTALVPILDAFNSHNSQQANVEYKYMRGSKKFVASVSRDVAPGSELFDTLGNRADLFPTYGFVNGDFSERTSALLAGHGVVDVRVESPAKHAREQQYQILRYLQQDDGYKECVTNDDVVAMRFKRLKRKVLLAIVNRYRNWVVSFPPRKDNEVPIPIDDGVNQIIATCRLLAMSHYDYKGKADTLLHKALDKLANDFESPLELEKDGDELEYRALVWVWRLASNGLNEHCGSFDEPSSCIEKARSEIESLDKHSKPWLAAYARHQEITALGTLKQYAEHSYNEYAKFAENFDPESKEFFFRNTLCPSENLALF